MSKVNKINKLVESTMNDATVEIWLSDNFQNKLRRILKDKREKDEACPKRPLTPYIKFCQNERSQVSRDNPNLNTKQVTAALGHRWNDFKKTNPEHLKKYGYVVKV